MDNFTFSDYLKAIEKSISNSDFINAEKLKQEIQELRNHKASSTSMSKHLSNFKTLKLLNDKYAMKFN